MKGLLTQVMGGLEPKEKAKVEKAAKEIPALDSPSPFYVKPAYADDVANFLMAGMHVAVGGSSGCGKTYPLKQICIAKAMPHKVIAANRNLDAETLISQPAIKGGTSYHQDGPLTHAMRHGYILIIDEGDSLEGGEALVFNDALESGRITIPATGEVVHAQPGFAAAFTSNSLGDELGIYNREGFDESLKQRCMAVIAKPLTVAQETRIALAMKNPAGEVVTKEQAEVLVKWLHAARPLHFGLNGNEPVIGTCPSTRTLALAIGHWLGFNPNTNATFPSLRDRLAKKDSNPDIRKALWYPFASRLNSEERNALKAANLWIW